MVLAKLAQPVGIGGLRMSEKKKMSELEKKGLYPSEEDTVCSPEFPDGCMDVETGEETLKKLEDDED